MRASLFAPMKSEILVAYATFPNSEVAETICRELVVEGVIACANIFPPHKAIYSWGGQVQSESEVAAIMKLNSRKKKTLMERVRATHPYSVPALVFWPIDDGLPDFVKWVYGQSL